MRSVEVEHLAKQYVIGGARELGYRTLRDSIAGMFRRTGGRAARETIWALRDVSFAIEQGEIVGIVGRNGAGKSTLLKILSRITEPTEGAVRLYGRVGSLLEVGTGFHPELTGRENIFLNGAILGMGRAEIARKLDDIVDFSEIGQFIDTPVKRYSSGMYVRLAFGVAAHLETDILVVDEVLAVGDAGFQKKCLSKMEDVGKHGRTILFVSHNTAAITRLCKRVVLIEHGKVSRDGDAHDVVRYYLRSDLGTTALREWSDPSTAPGNGIVRLRRTRIVQDGLTSDKVDIRRPVTVQMEYDVLQGGNVLMPNLHFANGDGMTLFASLDLDPGWRGRSVAAGTYLSSAVIPGNLLMDGTVTVTAAISTLPSEVHVFERDAVAFDVVDPGEGDGARGDYGGGMPGVLMPLLAWTNERIDGTK